ncbi:hypothetical protein AKJ38_03715 [candidate division MSBL1 archaeon SCGC-AAA259I14]|uniref:Uncharacterized protein n=1 Tax=candidate division MSBL1 archaeon SCGC-AAA259I14 TaxID=1698268 RepID=A0A133UPZ8_9EURY|nr:hypothetical protein AKJ38_03715 [candidate division MSBL1 archaeon SCGC-AAA259I14]
MLYGFSLKSKFQLHIISMEIFLRVKKKGYRMSDEAISEELLEILACPYCKKRVKLEGEKLICPECGREYPIEDGIPNMLPDELR